MCDEEGTPKAEKQERQNQYWSFLIFVWDATGNRIARRNPATEWKGHNLNRFETEILSNRKRRRSPAVSYWEYWESEWRITASRERNISIVLHIIYTFIWQSTQT